MDKCNNHGGKREGAGRKSKGNEIMQIRISPDVAKRIRREAEERGCSLGDIIEQYIHLNKQKERGV